MLRIPRFFFFTRRQIATSLAIIGAALVLEALISLAYSSPSERCLEAWGYVGAGGLLICLAVDVRMRTKDIFIVGPGMERVGGDGTVTTRWRIFSAAPRTDWVEAEPYRLRLPVVFFQGLDFFVEIYAKDPSRINFWRRLAAEHDDLGLGLWLCETLEAREGKPIPVSSMRNFHACKMAEQRLSDILWELKGWWAPMPEPPVIQTERGVLVAR